MKNSDMKVIAIILAIALFFTIVTSSVVSIASVAVLLKGNTAPAAADADNSGNTDNSSTPSNSSSSTPSNSSSSTPSSSSSTPSSSSSTPSSSSSTPSSSSSTPAQQGGSDTPAQQGGNETPAQQGGNDAPAQQGATAEEVFNFYKKACDEIKNNGVAGHTRKEWQEVKAFNLGRAGSVLQPVIESFMTKEADAEAKVSPKGSDEAKDRMCPCTASFSKVASATREELPNGNYKVTIVMQDDNTPEKGSDGVAGVATGILYYSDVQDTVQNDDTVKKVVKSLDSGGILYKAYTIEAEMTKDGKFVSISHVTSGEITATVTVVLLGQMQGSGTLEFHSVWTDFQY
ncbi:MAG: hypothetical protein II738_03960 [Clostridia bacterium]|nr:hypothetical protein [Clostridia bacterium]